jgi:hypothetical protein
MTRKTVSMKLDEDVWKKARVNCVQKDLDYGAYVENLIKKDLKL